MPKLSSTRNKTFWYPKLSTLTNEKYKTGNAIPVTVYEDRANRQVPGNRPNEIKYQKSQSDCRTEMFKLPIDNTGQKLLSNWSFVYLKAYNIARQYDIENPTEWTLTTNKWKNKVMKYMSINFLTMAANILKDKHSIAHSVCEYHKNKKSALTNKQRGNIATFNLSPKPLNTRMVVMEFDKSSCNKQNLVGKQVMPFADRITRQFAIQFNRSNRTAKLLVRVPIYMCDDSERSYAPVSVDLGMRTFAACYDFQKYVCIGDNNIKLNALINQANNTAIKHKKSSRRYKRRRFKKIKNIIKDLHYKTAHFLCSNYTEVYVGDFKSKACKEANCNKTVKQRLNQYSFYKFKDTLDYIAIKYNTKVYRWNEYLTSKTCSWCGYLHKKLGASEIFKCPKCKKETYRDCNAARNGMINTLI